MEALNLTLRYEYWWNDSHPSTVRFMRYKRNGPKNTKEISSWMTKETTKHKSKLLAFSQAILI